MATKVEGVVRDGVFVEGKHVTYYKLADGRLFADEAAADDAEALILQIKIRKLFLDHQYDQCCSDAYKRLYNTSLIFIADELVNTDLGLKLKTLLEKI